MNKLKFEPRDFSKYYILEAMEKECSIYSIEELEDMLNLDSDEIGTYTRSTLLEKIYLRHSNEELFEMFNLWDYFEEMCG